MPDPNDTQVHAAVPTDRDALLWRWLDQATEQWTRVDLSDLTAARSSVLMRLVRIGQIQLRQAVTARGRAGAPQARATCVMTGDYKKALVRTIRGAVPELGDHVVIQPSTTVEYRLSAAGLATQTEIRAFGGGAWEQDLLSKSLEFTIPGVVSITDLQYDQPLKAAVEPSTTEQADAKGINRCRQAPAWPVSKTDGYVAAYHAARKREYLTLARDVLDEKPGADEQFRTTFGPTAIAKAINAKAIAPAQRPCRTQDVLKTHTYRHLIQPLLQRPPRRPVGWDESIAERTGEDLPDILADIPLEDEDP